MSPYMFETLLYVPRIHALKLNIILLLVIHKKIHCGDQVPVHVLFQLNVRKCSRDCNHCSRTNARTEYTIVTALTP